MMSTSENTTLALMVQGTGSDVGKSFLVAGLARAFTRRGLRVRPFKPQNMSNNAAVTIEGGEIGRAQALQALAAGEEPSVHMNPVLLKPETDRGAQVVVQGTVWGHADARAYHDLKPRLMASVLDSFYHLAGEADLVLVEGAGSPAEVNLRAGDIANMGFALAANVPVVLVGDVARGGVIAALIGTCDLLNDEERALVRGIIINRFRGDVTLFDDALAVISQKTGLPDFGVVPHFPGARQLPAEDALSLDSNRYVGAASSGARPIRIAVPRLSRIANFDDLDPLAAEADVALVVVEPGDALPGDADVIILPGTKATTTDMAFLSEQGWDIDITAHVRRGGQVVGLCGGFQMLGHTIADEDGIEGRPGSVLGLGLLDMKTVLGPEKTLKHVTGHHAQTGARVSGYEMHMGTTTGPALSRPWLSLDGERAEGAVSNGGRIMGGYVHGVFADDGFRGAFLTSLRQDRDGGAAYGETVERTLDALADHFEAHLDLDGLLAVAGPVAKT